MTNGLRVNDISPVGERTGDRYRGRVGGSNAGVDSLMGVDMVGTLADGQVWVKDPITGDLIPGYIEDLGTSETDTGKRLAPDGAGGVDWVTASASPGFLTNTEGGQAAVVTNVAADSAATLDLALGNTFDLTLTANCTVTITDPPPAGVEGKITVILRQGGSGSYTVTWPGSVVWQAADGTATGAAPTLHTVVGAEDVITLATLDGGTTWGGELEGSATGGTVTSVGLSMPAEFSVGSSPVTGSGTIAVTKATESANTVWAGPTSGAAAQPTFRALVAADIPTAGFTDHEHVMGYLVSGDGATTVFELPAAPFDAYSVAAYVSGVLSEVTLSGAMLTTATFGSAPASATNNIRFDIVAAVL